MVVQAGNSHVFGPAFGMGIGVETFVGGVGDSVVVGASVAVFALVFWIS